MKKPFDRIITVMFENQYRSYVMQNPFLKKLAKVGAEMSNYFGAFHPSQTNYIASLAGEICNVTNDTPPSTPLMQQTLVDVLEAKNISWKAYMEAYPGEPWKKEWSKSTYPEKEQPINQYPPKGAKQLSRYYRKHNAFASFHTIQKKERRWNKIVSDIDFWKDVSNQSLPEYSWFTPDIWNDGHYLYNTHIDTDPRTQLVPQLSAWLEHVFLGNIATTDIQEGTSTGLDSLGLNLDIDLLLTDPKKAWAASNVPKGTLIVITFDEADFNAVGYDTNYDGPNQIYTVLLGDMITPGTVISTPYNHYNLIRTVQENFQLESLYKNDYGANWFRFLWGESFKWNPPTATDFPTGNALAITQGTTGLHMMFSNSNGELFDSFFTSSGWSQPNPLEITTKGTIALTTIDNITVLIHTGIDGEILSNCYNYSKKKWSKTESLQQKTSGGFAITTYYDMVDATHKLMLCWVSSDGFIQSMQGNANGFSNSVISVNQLTDGPMTLGQLGASLFLVYKERNTRYMRMTSYNVGAFNAFDAVDFQGNPAPENNTSLHQWSVTDYPVGNFSKKMASLGNKYQNIGQMTMATVSGEIHLVHGGGYADITNAYTEVFGLTGIYSATNELSNGYGTLDQAGWTKEESMNDVNIVPDNPISICGDGKTVTLVWADSKSKTIQYRQGGYRTCSK
ncbi:alkaline phosphatase family protein [Aquimarina sp. 2201CG14-23]|uniref:alkaline phosphatase family protein n=1 Tax=Aquimarina mycalae TaxID=3040073 RepID=UPI002477D00E|nr:alkaline phosphatase family protein [Aquimarina sp. 2201CG14-23]MDH7447492.1 alkaline phosphatase family protein [Aquimarina sp. 2201CG14-23]